MAAIQLNPIFEGISNTIGEMVFYQKNGKTFVRRKGVTNNPNTAAQQQVRSAFAAVVKQWQNLNADTKQAWINFARSQARNGYNLFISINVKRQRKGLPLKIQPDISPLRMRKYHVGTERVSSQSFSPLRRGRCHAVTEGVSSAEGTTSIDITFIKQYHFQAPPLGDLGAASQGNEIKIIP